MKAKLMTAVLSGVIACTAVGATLAATADVSTSAETDVKFHFLNVNDIPGYATIGSADCILIEDNGVITLLDAGYYAEYSIERVVNYIKALGITKIDHLFLTHPHNDHAGGMPAVINNFDIGTIYLKATDWKTLYTHEQGPKGTRVMYDDVYLAAKRKLNSDGSTVTMVHPEEDGMTVQINAKSNFEIWNCIDPWEDKNYRPEFNDYTMVMKYNYKDVSALLLGDINMYYESSLVGNIGECEIFKVAHHGTWGTISTDTLFEEVKAKVGVITGIRGNFGTVSSGYEHYTKATENKMKELGVEYTLVEGKSVTVAGTYKATLDSANVSYTENQDGTLSVAILGSNIESALTYHGIDYEITQDGDVIITTDGTDGNVSMELIEK